MSACLYPEPVLSQHSLRYGTQNAHLCRLSIQAGCEIVNVQREENYYIFPWLMNKYLKTVLPPGDASDCSVFFYNVKDSEKINST